MSKEKMWYIWKPAFEYIHWMKIKYSCKMCKIETNDGIIINW